MNDARRGYRKILDADPRHADALHMLGMVEQQSGRFDAAIGLISQAIALHDAAPYHFNLARVFEDAGRWQEAAGAYRKTIALWPDNADAHANLGSVLQELGQLEEGAESFRQAIAREPGFAEAQTNLGNVLRELGQLAAAEACGRRAIELAPGFAEAHCNLGATLGRQGRAVEAIACYRHAILLQPDLAIAHHNLALSLLARGQMAEGWAEYEWRWQTPRMRNAQRVFAQKQWQGEAAVGRTLLIHAEQGFGDTLQFCRFVPLAAARGWRVVLEVQKPLARLLQNLPGVERVIGQGEALPRFDVHIPLLSLPRVLGTEIDTSPAAPAYLSADAAQSAGWRARLAAGPRIGLAWAGSPQLAADRQRSLAPQQLAPLCAVPGIKFFSLQKTGAAAPADFPITDFMPEMEDFSATAALIANLDLVISADTAVAHLAAALGRPVWLLNRFDSCWRWFAGRNDSPWYPSMRIYRQPSPDDWDTVVTAIARDLAAHSFSNVSSICA